MNPNIRIRPFPRPSLSTMAYKYATNLYRTVALGTVVGATASVFATAPGLEANLLMNCLTMAAWGAAGGVIYPLLPFYISRRILDLVEYAVRSRMV